MNGSEPSNPIINPCIDAIVSAALAGKNDRESNVLVLLVVGTTSIVP